jgi:DNA-binding Lrp family transcriptional regulator
MLVSFLFLLYLRRIYTVNMLNAFVFLNCDMGTEPAILNEINDISGVSEAVELIGVYDIVAKVSEESREDIAKSVRKIRAIASVRSCLTMIVSEKEHSLKQIEETVA